MPSRVGAAPASPSPIAAGASTPRGSPSSHAPITTVATAAATGGTNGQTNSSSPLTGNGPDTRRSSLQRLKARSPPSLKPNGNPNDSSNNGVGGGGGDHSPAHQSNSTSPFFMGHNATSGGAHIAGSGGAAGSSAAQRESTDDAGSGNAGGAHNPKENSFTYRQPTRSHTQDEAYRPTASPPSEAVLYPLNPDLLGRQLTAYEEAEPRGSAGGIPAMVVLRHRMGFSTVVLSSHQRTTYSRYDLENFVLYKEQKYNAVNVLWRFSMLVLLMLTFSVFCLVFSTCTTEWVRLEHTDNYLSLGLFVMCRDKSLRSCDARTSARLEWQVTDAVTGATVCTASSSFVQRFIGATWAMSILQLLCELIALALTSWIVSRPTRSGALVLLFFILLLGTASGIVAVVLFHHYSACLRQTCVGEHLGGRLCSVTWRYGYKLYLGGLAVHGIVLLLALCMHSYIHNIRVTARKQLRAERRRASHRHADAEDYMVHVLDDLDGARQEEDEGEEVSGSAAAAASAPRQRQEAPTREGGYPRELEESPFLPLSLQAHHPAQRGEDALAHSSLHVSFAGVPGEQPRVSPLLRQARSMRLSASQPSPASDAVAAGGSRSHTMNGSLRSSGRPEEGGIANSSELTARSRAERSATTSASQHRHHHQDRKDRKRGRRQRQKQSKEAQREANEFPRGSRHRPQHHSTSPTSASRKSPSTDTPAYQQARKRSRFFVRFFNRSYDATYLTAAELGVPIAGADDWVYDDRSDMYYSFERNMFWDPLTREYYNCALKTWQESPNQVLEVRDVLDYMLLESDEGEEELEEDEIEEIAVDDDDVDNRHNDNDDPQRWREAGEARASGGSSYTPSTQRRREPINSATGTATTGRGGLDGSARTGAAASVTSRVAAHHSADTEDEEPVFAASHENDSAFHSMGSNPGPA